MAYDFVIVGAGMFGATLARELTDRGKKVLVVERRNHIAGMTYTEKREGIVYHRYGPHVFHTNDERIWKYLHRFGTFRQFMVRTKAMAKGRLYSFPVNLMTLYQLWGVRTPAEAAARLEREKIPIAHPENVEEWVLSELGREIYETFFKGYTQKQWGRAPGTLPPGIAKRLPIRLTYDDNYFTDRYQGVPEGGFTPVFERMLDGIEVRLEVDFLSDPSLKKLGRVIYSGRIDEYFGYRYGELEFRSCRFESKTLNGDYQGNPVINYTDAQIPYTRVIEHKHFEHATNPHTIVSWEHPFECGPKDVPLYPINDVRNNALYDLYRKIETETIFAGRLGTYRYVDLHQVIAQAWTIAEDLT